MRFIIEALLASLLVGTAARAEDLESDAVYVPVAADSGVLAVRNPLGSVKVQGWDQQQVRVIAHKRAGSADVLGRLKVRVDLTPGKVQITTGFYLSDHTFNPLPLGGAAIDLIIEAPRHMELSAASYAGDVEAAGLRAGAHLSSQAGRIRVADMEGPVDTRTLDGNQWLQAIRGSLAATGVVGDMELAGIEGQRVDASVFKGQIIARDVHAAVVRLHTVAGTILLFGGLSPGARYELGAKQGDVRLELTERPFRFVAHSPSVRTGFALERSQAAGVTRGTFAGGGTTELQLASGSGEVSIMPLVQSHTSSGL